MSDEWKSEMPTESGYYFYHEESWIDGVRDRSDDQIIYISVGETSVDVIEMGTDDPNILLQPKSPAFLKHPTELAHAWQTSRNPIFMFTPEAEKEKLKDDLVVVVVQMWLSKIDYKKFDVQANLKDLKIIGMVEK